MDLSRFTEKSQDALRSAQALATRRNHQGVDVEHLLAALGCPIGELCDTKQISQECARRVSSFWHPHRYIFKAVWLVRRMQLLCYKA